MTSKLVTNKLFTYSLAIFILGIACSYVFFSLGYKNEETPFIVLFLMVAFGLNIAGLIFSFSERKIDKKKATMGMIGNLLFILLYLSSAVYVVASI